MSKDGMTDEEFLDFILNDIEDIEEELDLLQWWTELELEQ